MSEDLVADASDRAVVGTKTTKQPPVRSSRQRSHRLETNPSRDWWPGTYPEAHYGVI